MGNANSSNEETSTTVEEPQQQQSSKRKSRCGASFDFQEETVANLEESINELSKLSLREQEHDSDSDHEEETTEADGNIPIVKALKVFPGHKITHVKQIGEGGFGKMLHGQLQGTKPLPVAIKVFQVPLSPEKGYDYLSKLMGLRHRNIVSIIGLVLDNTNYHLQAPVDCPRILMQYFPDGNLLNYLSKSENPQDYAMMGKLALDIISGCEYLHSKEIVHGNLAARNILIQKCLSKHKTHYNAKVSDYGITTKLAEDTKIQNWKISPTRWLPRELLMDGTKDARTQKTDVWSFGVVLWEMWTKGNVPYGSFKEKEVCHLLRCGKSPLDIHRPIGCPDHIVAVMESIFQMKPEGRPTFEMLKEAFTSFRSYGIANRSKEEIAKAKEAEKKLNQVDGGIKKETDAAKNDSQSQAAAAGGIEKKLNLPPTQKGPGAEPKDVKVKGSATEIKGKGKDASTESKEKGPPNEPKGKAPPYKGSIPPKHSGKAPKRITGDGYGRGRGRGHRFPGPAPYHHHRPHGPHGPGPMPAGLQAPPPYTPVPLPSHFQMNFAGSTPVPGPSDIQTEIQRREEELKLLKTQQLQQEYRRKQGEMEDIMNKMAQQGLGLNPGVSSAPLSSTTPAPTGYSFVPPPPPLFHPGEAHGPQPSTKEYRSNNKKVFSGKKTFKNQSRGNGPKPTGGGATS